MKQIIRRVAALVVGLGLGAVALAGLEAVTHISDLNASWPLGSDLASTSDDHIRNIKSALKTDFPNFNGTYTSASAPVFAIPNDTNTGMYGPSADNLAWATGGTQRAVVNSTGNWTFAAPTSGASVTVNNGGTGQNAVFNSSSASGGYNVYQANTSDVGYWGSGNRVFSGAVTDFAINAVGNNKLSLGTNSVERISVAGTGIVQVNAPSSTSSSTGGSAFNVIAPNTASASFGVFVEAGTNSSDISLLVNNAPNTKNLFEVRGDGFVLLPGATQPFFNAQRITSSQTITNSAVVDLVFNSTNTQNGGTNYSTSTGIFTAPVAGIYTFSVTVDTTTSGGLTNSINAIYFSKNNTTSVGASRYDIAIGQVPSSQGTGITWRWSGSVTLSLAASDTIRVKFDNGAGTGGTIVLNIGSWFTGYLLG